jgi:endo-alpha-1,4-polygalactosaminidase (GH114 family)|tara:strand:- start:528 stop:935 length:408 start_codon:yes stop_codon:yes gene_type:complete
MNNQKRRPFRPRQNKSNYRSRSNSQRSNNNSHFQGNNGNSFSRNGSMSNPFNVEKTIQKYQQLAKDAQSFGDPVLVENYLQHADHYSRRLSELNNKVKSNSFIKEVSKEESLSSDTSSLNEKTEAIQNKSQIPKV